MLDISNVPVADVRAVLTVTGVLASAVTVASAIATPAVLFTVPRIAPNWLRCNRKSAVTEEAVNNWCFVT